MADSTKVKDGYEKVDAINNGAWKLFSGLHNNEAWQYRQWWVISIGGNLGVELYIRAKDRL